MRGAARTAVVVVFLRLRAKTADRLRENAEESARRARLILPRPVHRNRGRIVHDDDPTTAAVLAVITVLVVAQTAIAAEPLRDDSAEPERAAQLHVDRTGIADDRAGRLATGPTFRVVLGHGVG